MKSAFALIGILALFFASTVSADPGDTLWARTYGGEGYEYGFSVQHTTDGGFIAVGYTYPYVGGPQDIYVVKTSANGDTMWTRTYGGDGSDGCRTIRQLPDGGYILGAYTASFGAGSFDLWLIRTDSNGDTLWTRTYGGERNDQVFSIQLTNDGGYIGVGLTDTSTVIYDDQVWLVKTDADGAEEWSKIYGGFGYEHDDLGWEVQQTADGGYIVVGTSRSFGPGSQDVWLLKTDPNGDTTWTKTFGGLSNDVGLSVDQTLDGGYIVGGHTQSFGAGNRDFYLIKTQPNGDSVWTRAYGGSSYDLGYSVRQTPDGGYAFTGYTNSFGAGGYDVWLLKIAPNGDTLWSRTYGGSSQEQAYFLDVVGEEGYIISGYTGSYGAGHYDMYLVRVMEGGGPEVSIELTPDDPPVVVPRGGSFGFTGTVTNNTNVTQRVDIWLMAYVPGIGRYGPLKKFNNVPFRANQSRSAHLNQKIPNIAPVSDQYIYYGYVGDYPSTVIDSSCFPFEVTAKELAKAGADEWTLTGSFLEGSTADLPTEFALMSNHPNPFNAGTVITYRLPSDSHVKLEVYNISGQKVATLVNGNQEAGYKSVTWDASETSSGVYFYKLTAGDFTKIKTMTLLR